MVAPENISRHRILQLAGHLLGKRVAAINPLAFTDGNFTKSDIADVIEGNHYGVPKNSRSEADFAGTGIELKVTPVEANASGDVIRPKERMVISMVDYGSIATHERWDGLDALTGKLDPVLFIWYDATDDDRTEHRVVWADLWRPSAKQSRQMQRDYEQIRSKVTEGSRLSGSDGDFLSTCPKHRGGWDEDPELADSNSIVGHHPTLDHAQRRGWQIKPGGMLEILAASTDLPVVTDRARGLSTDALYARLEERSKIGGIDA